MSEQAEYPVNSPTEPSQRPALQEILGQVGRQGPFRYGRHIQVTDVKGHKNASLPDPHGYSQSVHGFFRHRDIVGMDEGNVTETDIGHEPFLLRSLLADYVLSMSRGVQVVYPKDSGQVTVMGDIFPDVRVLEVGVGSSTLTMNLPPVTREAGRLLSTGRREDFAQIAVSNVDAQFGRHYPAWELRTGDLADVTAARAKPGSIDRVVLDMFVPWENVEAASQALAPDGFFLAYVITVTQLPRAVEAPYHSGLFTEPESWESIVRTWNVDGPAMRPDHRMVAHAGLLLTARRLAMDPWSLTRKRLSAHGAYDEGGYWLPDDVKEHTNTDKKVCHVLRDYRVKQSSDVTPVFSGSVDDDQNDVNHV